MNHETHISDHKALRYQDTRRVTVVGAAVNVVLAVLKLVFGWLGHSQALIADGLHSFSDLISDGVVLVAAKHGQRHADDDHPYGHARFETAATVTVGALLAFIAFEFIVEAVKSLVNLEALPQPTNLVLVVTVFSILSKEALYHYTMVVAKRLNSSMLRANAWHHRTDSISSVIVLVGVLGTMSGIIWLDAAAAIVVGLMIAHIGLGLVKQGFVELVDTALDPAKVDNIRSVIRNTPGVQALHELRSRRMGDEALVDVHILVDDRISVSEGHQISESVRARVIRNVGEVSNVLVHIDPEDDQAGPLNARLPLRDTVLQELETRWMRIEVTRHIEHVNLHYLSGSISVDVYLPLHAIHDMQSARDIAIEFNRRGTQIPYIKQVKVFYYASG